MEQLLLIQNEPAPVAQSRRTDPITSVIAADDFKKSGTAQVHEQLIVNYTRQNPGETAREMEESIPLSQSQISRRLKGLIRKGLIHYGARRDCRIKGSSMQTIWPGGE